MPRPTPRKPRGSAPRAIHRRFSRWLLAIRRSKIHGTGVFALEEIPRGIKVVEYTGERIPLDEAVRRSNRWLAKGARGPIYLAYANARWAIDGAFHGCGAELVNHSCAPNLESYRRRGRLWFVSKRRIANGDELTLDYRFPPNAKRMRCRCGARNCRGTINLKGELKHGRAWKEYRSVLARLSRV